MNVIAAIVAAPLLFKLIPLTSHDLTHQTANLHTIVMTTAALIVLPIAPFLNFTTEAYVGAYSNSSLCPRIS